MDTEGVREHVAKARRLDLPHVALVCQRCLFFLFLAERGVISIISFLSFFEGAFLGLILFQDFLRFEIYNFNGFCFFVILVAWSMDVLGFSMVLLLGRIDKD